MSESLAWWSTDPKLLANAIVVINMGGEMIYILEQRLKAQNISLKKSGRVLEDVIQTMFGVQTFDDMLLKPSLIFDSGKLRNMFRQIAHSSIMRLNYQSMDKLFDLMLMGFKMQMVFSRDVYEMLECTVNHLDGILCVLNSYPPKTSAATEVVTRTRAVFVKRYGSLSTGQLLVVRKQILYFLQDRRIKVSVLLQKKLQSRDGHIRHRSTGKLCLNADIPGEMFWLNSENTTKDKIKDTLKLINAKSVSKNIWNEEWTEIGGSLSKLGTNLYASRDKTRSLPKTTESEANTPTQKKTKEEKEQMAKAARTELDMLAHIVMNNSDTKDSFALDLFDNEGITMEFGEEEENVTDMTEAEDKNDVIRFQQNKVRGSVQLNTAIAQLDLGDGDAFETFDNENGEAGDDDLLGLMDNA